jgi:hypothetical protein
VLDNCSENIHPLDGYDRKELAISIYSRILSMDASIPNQMGD